VQLQLVDAVLAFPEVSMSMLSSHDQVATIGSSATRHRKVWSRVGEESRPLIFAAAAIVAMAGWLFLLAKGLWETANWLVS
jgi:hypothetical protein